MRNESHSDYQANSHAFRSPRYGTVHPPLFRAECYLTSSACLALREQYDDGLRKGLLKPRREFCTDIALSQVTENFELPPLRIQYCAYTRIYPGGAHRPHADAVTLKRVAPITLPIEWRPQFYTCRTARWTSRVARFDSRNWGWKSYHASAC